MKSIQANETKLMETCQKKLGVFFCPNGAREKPSPSCEGGGVTGLYFLHCETCRCSSCNKHFVSFFRVFFRFRHCPVLCHLNFPPEGAIVPRSWMRKQRSQAASGVSHMRILIRIFHGGVIHICIPHDAKFHLRLITSSKNILKVTFRFTVSLLIEGIWIQG